MGRVLWDSSEVGVAKIIADACHPNFLKYFGHEIGSEPRLGRQAPQEYWRPNLVITFSIMWISKRILVPSFPAFSTVCKWYFILIYRYIIWVTSFMKFVTEYIRAWLLYMICAPESTGTPHVTDNVSLSCVAALTRCLRTKWRSCVPVLRKHGDCLIDISNHRILAFYGFP